MVLQDLRRVDRRSLDKLVGRQRMPCFHLERLDKRSLGHRCAVDHLVWLPG
jgi:hypothetical protein